MSNLIHFDENFLRNRKVKPLKSNQFFLSFIFLFLLILVIRLIKNFKSSSIYKYKRTREAVCWLFVALLVSMYAPHAHLHRVVCRRSSFSSLVFLNRRGGFCLFSLSLFLQLPEGTNRRTISHHCRRQRCCMYGVVCRFLLSFFFILLYVIDFFFFFFFLPALVYIYIHIFTSDIDYYRWRKEKQWHYYCSN